MLKMIIVDDEKKIRESMKNCIDWENLGIRLTGLCKNGLEAYDMILDENPDIVLTDIKMPALSGLELIRRITQIGQDVEFIIVSGYGEFPYTKEAMRQGIKHYLLKPYNEDELLEVVLEAAGGCRHRQELRLKKSGLPKKYDEKILQNIQEGVLNENLENLKKKMDSIEDSTEILGDMERFLITIHDPELLRMALTSIFIHIFQKQGGTQYYVLEYLAKLYGLSEPAEVRKGALESLSLLLPGNVVGFTGKDCVDRTIQYVYGHLSDPELSLKQIAEKQLFMNVDYLSKQFLKHVGCKFSSFLAKARIEEAKKILMQDSDVSIYEVADAVGCGNNPQYFSLLFKKVTGITATDYIKKIRKKG